MDIGTGISRRSAVALAMAFADSALIGTSNAQPAAASPAPRAHHSGAYDAAQGEFVIYGGFTFTNAVTRLGDVWAWNGRRWRFVGDTGVRKITAALAFDSARGRLLMFGGAGDGEEMDGQLRVLESGAWRTIQDAPAMTRSDASFVYDSKRDRAVLFGGRHAEILFADTWELDNQTWNQTWMAGPSLRSAAACAYDSTRGVTVLYGGFRPLAALADTWEWDGHAWRQISEAGAPGARSWPSLAYDARRGRVILHGGEDQNSQFFNDTWAWDGATWTRIATEGPPPRIQGQMIYDSARDRIVLFGGMGPGPQYLDDVWEFDGARWRQVAGRRG
jgi:Kelch motif